MDYCQLKLPEDTDKYKEFTSSQYISLTQHSLEWQQMLNSYDNWQWSALGACENDKLVACIPFCIRRTEIGSVLMSSPVAASYGGVLHVEECDRDYIYAGLCDKIVEYAKDNDIDLVSIFSSPFRDDLDLYDKYLRPDYTLKKFYQYLPKNYDGKTNTTKNFRNSLRKNLKKADNRGCRLVYDFDPDDKLIEQWYNEILAVRFSDIQTTAPDLVVFKKLVEYLRKSKSCSLSYVMSENQMVAGGIFLFGWSMDYYLRATKSEQMKFGVGMLLDYRMIAVGKERGANVFNFQSSPSKESASYEYKRRWGCLEGETAYMVKVTGDLQKFINAGKEKVTELFPHYFVLPYTVYGE